MDWMLQLLQTLFTPGDFEPHIVHFYEHPGLMWFIIAGNALVALSYFLIPVILFYFARKRRDLAFHWVFYFFAAFIFFCALTHVLHILIFWYPVYWLEGIIDTITGIVSIVTAFALIPVIPAALQLRSPSMLEKLNRDLELQNKSQANKMLAIVSSSDDAIMAFSLSGEVLTWNLGAEKLYGFTEKEIKGKQCDLLIPKSRLDEIQAFMEQIRAGQVVRQYESERLAKDGTVIPVSVTWSPIFGADGMVEAVSVIARDISERKNAEERKNEFISMASHELKTPITSLKGYAQIMQSKAEQKGDGVTAEFLSKMNSQIDRVSRLVEDLLSVSRLQSNDLSYTKESASLHSLVEDAVHTMRVLFPNRTIVTSYLDDPWVVVDKVRISQVLSNLLMNALKYSPSQSTVTVTVKKEDAMVRVSVKDEGIGISPEDKAHIFEKFYRMNGTEREHYPGMGVGLYIASEIVKEHGGTVGVESEQGKGSEFYFTLPYEA